MRIDFPSEIGQEPVDVGSRSREIANWLSVSRSGTQREVGLPEYVEKRCPLVVDRTQHLSDRSQRQIPDFDEGPDESESLNMVLRVLGLIVSEALPPGEKPSPQIELDRGDRDPTPSTQLRDSHAIPPV